MSLSVMTAPLTIAVALRTPGSRWPTNRALFGISRAVPPVWAAATTDRKDATSVTAAPENLESFIIPPMNAGLYPAQLLLNRSLAASPQMNVPTRPKRASPPRSRAPPLASQILQRHPDQEGVSPAGVARGLVIPPPGHAELDTVVVVEDTEPVPDRLEAIRERERILVAIGEIDHGRAEDRPITGETHPAAET